MSVNAIGKALVVKDYEGTYGLTVEVLHGFNYDVDVVSSGPEAVELARRKGYRLVVADVFMAGMEARIFYDEMVAIYPTLSGRMLFTVPALTSGILNIFRGCGCEFLCRPFTRDKLEIKICAIEEKEFVVKRAYPRFDWEGGCRILNSREFKAITEDISINGARIKFSDGELNHNSMVNFFVGGMGIKRHARVMWTKEHEGTSFAGLQFDKTIPEDVLIKGVIL